jgi:serine protease inhibitor
MPPPVTCCLPQDPRGNEPVGDLQGGRRGRHPPFATGVPLAATGKRPVTRPARPAPGQVTDMSHTQAVLRSPLVLLLASVLAVSGCGVGGPPSGSPTASPAEEPSATTPTATAAAPTPTTRPVVTSPPAATPGVAPAALAPGSLAVTVSDRLRVRSQPRVSDDSTRYEPLLPTGTELLVIEGPVRGSGYEWYRVAPVSLTLSGGATEGWVAAGDHDGTPWVAAAGEPLVGLEFAQSAVVRSAGTARQAKAAGDSINAFTVDMYGRLRTDPTANLDGRNIVFSPTSIALALAMARAGARGATATEMDDVLRVDGWRPLAARLNSLDKELAGHNATWTDDDRKTHTLSLRIANAAFGQRGYAIQQEFLDAIAEAFGAQLGLVDFEADPEAARQVINAWVSRQTAHRIPELLVPGNVRNDTRLALVNAIYLKANWQLEFDTERTVDRPFTRGDGTKVEVPTMSLEGEQEVPYASGPGWKATELRYAGANGTSPLAMTLVLPDNLGAFERGLTAAKVDSIVAKLDGERARIARTKDGPPDDWGMACPYYPYQVRLFLPRFGADTRASLVAVLKRMGMGTAFDPGRADFSGITGSKSLFISEVIHQANIDVDEKGTEAAAATAILFDVTGGCGPAQPLKTITLRLNRPFLFVVRDVESGAILFMGRVMDPSVR